MTDAPAAPHRADWFARCRFGVSVHWTARSAPLTGAARPFAQAAEAFDVSRFVTDLADAGADYLLFTLTHALHHLPAPHALVDAILPGRTCPRDLPAELIEAAHRRGLRVILYYNHSCNGDDDPVWKQAVGYARGGNELDRFAERTIAIVRLLGERYGRGLDGWWFDSCYSVDPRGPINTVSTDIGQWQFPWDEHARAAGHPDRIISYNAGIGETWLYTADQDYWAGETVQLDRPPTARFLPGSLQNHVWTCLDNVRWVYGPAGAPLAGPRFDDATLLDFLRQCRRHQTPMTFNVDISQEGVLSPRSLEQLRRLGLGV